MITPPATHFCLLPPFPGLGSGSHCCSATWFSKPTSTPRLSGRVPPGPLPGPTAGHTAHSSACSISLQPPGAVGTGHAPLPSWTRGRSEQRLGLSRQHVQRARAPLRPLTSAQNRSRDSTSLHTRPKMQAHRRFWVRRENNSPKNVISRSIYGFFPIPKVTHNHY